MEKKLFPLIMERVATDDELRKRIPAMDDAGFEAVLKENGVKDIPADNRAKMLDALKSYISKDGELTDEAMDLAAGGEFDGDGEGWMSCCVNCGHRH